MADCGRKRGLLWLYLHVVPLAWLSECAYRLVAINREPLAMLRRIWYGRDLKLPTFHIASALFLRLLGVIYLIAFVSLWVQVDGLIGDHGIAPVQGYLDGAQQFFSQQSPPESAVWNVPTLAWLNPHTGFLHILCAVGTVLSLMLIFGLLPLPTLVLLWIGYLSLFHAGQMFFSFQWDILLLEAGFVAIFLAPFAWRSRFLADRHPSRLAIWLVWWLLFRLMLESGAVKLTWTVGQPGGNGAPIANTWSAVDRAQFPLLDATAADLDELVCGEVAGMVSAAVGDCRAGDRDWLIVVDFRAGMLRYIACGAITLLMLLIAATGNYNFFNLLTILLALMLLDDRAGRDFLRRRIRGTDWPALAAPTRWRMFLLVPFAALVVFLGTRQVKKTIAPIQSESDRSRSKSGWNRSCW